MALSTIAAIDNELDLNEQATYDYEDKKGFELKYPKEFSGSGLQGYKIFLDRYTIKEEKGALLEGDLVLAIVNKDIHWPKKEIGIVEQIFHRSREASIKLVDGEIIVVDFDLISKPLELYPAQVKKRVASALTKREDESVRDQIAEEFEDVLFDHFIPGGRILAGAGQKGLTLQNCFVLPSPDDSRGGIFDSVKEMAETHSRGGGVGINLSSLRPRYSKVVGVNGISSGAVSWAKMYNLSTGLIEQGGSRRGATMLMLDVWHPDVMEFITAKHTPGEFENSNMSVCITDDFMDALNNGEDWGLLFPDTTDPEYDSFWNGDIKRWIDMGKKVLVYKTVKALDIWNAIVNSAWMSAEPGLHFIDRSNKMSNSWYFSRLQATNPCGEQGLEGYGVCTLGAINLSTFVDNDGDVLWDKLRDVIKTSVRMLDNVIDVNEYHFPEISDNHQSNRRIGLGVMGFAEMLIRVGLRYGSDDASLFTDALFETIAEAAYLASIDLAKEKGAFPKFKADKYLQSGFMKGMSDEVRDGVAKHGIRNVCLITVAPTGTTGTMMGTSTGIEPYYSWQLVRKSRLGVHKEVAPVIGDLGLNINDLPEYCVTSMELSPEDHVNMQSVAQRWVDSAISKTTNCPADYSVESIDKLYRLAYDKGCKGITVYRDGSRHEQVLESVTDAEPDEDVCMIDDPECTSCAL
jgi:ribonucleoside-diphosphate reductase alpha chain|tara:strand:+ start:107 stop:2170 length:2064 start_codon:yes stop_codon:yes gene_type:complete